MQTPIVLLLLLTPFALAAKGSNVTFNLLTLSDLLRPSVMLASFNSYIAEDRGDLKKLSDVAKFAECPGSHETIFDIDVDDSYTVPDVIKKSKDMTQMFLEGVMTQTVHVDKLQFDVIWNGNLFHTEMHNQDADVEEQEAYEQWFEANIPPFAPSGNYKVLASVRSMGQELGCVSIEFNL